MTNSNKFYTYLNKFFESTNVDFMNHGYYPSHVFIKKEELLKREGS